jgi:hypothetical protein
MGQSSEVSATFAYPQTLAVMLPSQLAIHGALEVVLEIMLEPEWYYGFCQYPSSESRQLTIAL